MSTNPKILRKLPAHEKATATYSTFRMGILSLTPGDSKCRIYCKGIECRFCVVHDGPPELQAVPGLYSTWITDEILAMARPQQAHFDLFNLVDTFKKLGIRSVVNLQEFGEHSFCGNGVGSSGFSYDPERFMRGGIYYYNFPMADFQACGSSRLLDIVKVMHFALSIGKVAVHCHAGHGRTGMVIAAALMYSKGLSPIEAVALVRLKRPKSVQSGHQVDTLHDFKLLMRNEGGAVIPPRKFLQISQYVQYNLKFISRAEARLYGNIPKVVYVAMLELLRRFYRSVTIDLLDDGDDGCRFECCCEDPRAEETKQLDEDEVAQACNNDNFELIKRWYHEANEKGFTISSMEVHLQKLETYREIVRLVDFFFHTSFHQITFRDDLASLLTAGRGFDPNRASKNRDWVFTFFFLLECTAALPKPMRLSMARLITKWFLRVEGDVPFRIMHWINGNHP